MNNIRLQCGNVKVIFWVGISPSPLWDKNRTNVHKKSMKKYLEIHDSKSDDVQPEENSPGYLFS